MGEYSIMLRYGDKLYESDIDELDEKELEDLHTLIGNVCSDKTEYLTFKDGGKEYYFSKYILERSILTIIKK